MTGALSLLGVGQALRGGGALAVMHRSSRRQWEVAGLRLCKMKSLGK